MISTQPGLIMATHTNPLRAGWKPIREAMTAVLEQGLV